MLSAAEVATAASANGEVQFTYMNTIITIYLHFRLS